MYGGMGSFNDVVIGQTHVDGKFAWKKDAISDNNKLSKYRTTAYDLAIYIKHNHQV